MPELKAKGDAAPAGMKDFFADVPAPCRHGSVRGVKNET